MKAPAPFLPIRFQLESGALVEAGEAFVRALGRTGADPATTFWELAAPGQRNRITNELTLGRHGFDVDFLVAGEPPRTLRAAGVTSEDGVATIWFAPVADSAEHDAVATEKALRKQNAVLLDLGKVEEIDDGRLEVAFARITEAASAGLGCARASVWLFDEGKTAIVCQDLFQIQDGSHGAKGFTLTAADYPSYFAAMAEDRTIAADDCREHPATREFKDGYLIPLGITSMLEAPIRRKGKLIGVLCNEHVGPLRSFTQEEQNFAANVADYVSRALEASDRRAAMTALAEAHRALEEHATQLEVKVAERTRSIQLILDSTGEGLLSCSLDGLISAESSRALHAWFGPPAVGHHAKDYLFADASQRRAFEFQLAELVEDILPFEAIVDGMPRQVTRDGRTLRLQYRPVSDGEKLARLLCIVRDATAEVQAERAAREARELQAVAAHFVRDRGAFHAAIGDCKGLVETLAETEDLGVARRALHTLKGNAAVLGLESLAEAIHDVETLLAEDTSQLAEAKRVAQSSFEEVHARIGKVFGLSDERTIQIEEHEYEAFVSALVEAKVRRELVDAVRAWRAVPTRSLLDRLARQVERVAERLGKPVDVEVRDPGLRLPLEGMGPFFGSLVHVVRNAVDHGLEPEGCRVELGKPARGRITLEVERDARAFTLVIADDGAGIDWDAVTKKARASGLPTDTQEERESALFADGLSTRDEVSELSGRGVGLGAVLEATRALGGSVRVASNRGEGTTFRFTFPLHEAELARAA